MSTPIRIRRMILREIRMPLVEVFTISSGTESDRRALLIEVTDDDGVSAWGECVAFDQPNYSAETIETAAIAIERWLGPRVIGRTFEDPREVLPALRRGVEGHFMAKAGVEMAIWALVAEKRRVSLATLLGGVRKRIEVGISLGIQDSPEAIAARAERAVADGYRRIKLKIKPGKDVEYVRAARRALGDHVKLSVDANAAYTLADMDHLQKLDEFGLLMIEQPLRAGDILRHAALAKRLRTPICLDESITCVDEAEDAIACGAARLINIKPGRVGGLAESIAIHDASRARGVPNWCGGMLETGIGRAMNVALASLENFSLPGDISPSARYWQKDVVFPEWTMDANGFIDVPFDRPGLGVAVDMDRIDAGAVWRIVVK